MSRKIIPVIAFIIISALLNLAAYKLLENKAEAELEAEIERQRKTSFRLGLFTDPKFMFSLNENLPSNLSITISEDKFLKVFHELSEGVHQDIIHLSGGLNPDDGTLVDPLAIAEMDHYFYEENSMRSHAHAYLYNRIVAYVNHSDELKFKSSLKTAQDTSKILVRMRGESPLFKNLSSGEVLFLLGMIESNIEFDRHRYLKA